MLKARKLSKKELTNVRGGNLITKDCSSGTGCGYASSGGVSNGCNSGCLCYGDGQKGWCAAAG